MSGLLGSLGPDFASVSVFTDCAMPPEHVILGVDVTEIMAGNKGLPHACPEDKRCSRWVMEESP